jgi:hypothetical protein
LAARVYPSEYSELMLDGAQVRERDVLLELQAQLPDTFVIYHGLHWSRIEYGLTVTGRIQFLVLSPKAVLYSILMKTGLVKTHSGRLIKQLGEDRQDVFNALAEQVDLLKLKYRSANKSDLQVEPVFFCPDFKVPNASALTVDAQRVVDATDKHELAGRLLALDSNIVQPVDPRQAASIHRFLCNELDLVPEVGALSEVAETLVTRLSHGLEQWVGRLHFEPFRLRISGTAGSGKSQLALAELRRNHGLKARSLYVCYNRPLASHMGRQVRSAAFQGALAYNFHALCDRMLRDAGVEIDYAQPGVFDTLADRLMELPLDKRWVFDSIVVDEGQDFEQGWVEVLQRCAHPNTRWLWLEDPLQNLYNKPVVELPGWVCLSTPVNYRNPRRVIEALQQVRPLFNAVEGSLMMDIQAACPLEGLPLQVFSYDTHEALLSQSAKAITACLRQGFTREQIVVLSMRGHEKSRVLAQSALGPHSLRHFTGQYDEKGGQLFTQGSIYAESVYRFKGQSAQAVVITELAFEEFSETDFKKLFVAMTRAKLMLVIVGDVATTQKLNAAWWVEDSPTLD